MKEESIMSKIRNYKISVPILNSMVNKWGGERMLREIKRLDAERVFLCVDVKDPTTPDGKEQIDTLRQNAKFFHEAGLEVGSWNWTFYLPKDGGYQPIVNANGKVSREMVCPTDEKWKEFVGNHVAALGTCGLDMIMFDDDYRMGYHDVGFGCLCPNHIKMMEEFLGEKIDTAKMPDYILAGGPNKYRDALVRANGKSLEEFASYLRTRLDGVSPTTRMGYCTCMTNWDIDGTSGDEISRRLAGNTKPFYRLIGAPYWASMRLWGNDNLAYIIELERMEKSWNKDENIEIFAEGDVFPRPRHRIPAAFLEGLDTGLRAAGVLDGILKYGTDYSADPGYEDGYQTRHERSRDTYAAISRIFDGKDAVGLRCYEAPAKYTKMIIPEKMAGKTDVEDAFFGFSARMLCECSLPTVYEGTGLGGVCFGANAEFLPDEALDHGLILDVEAARILSARGVDVGVETFGESKHVDTEYWPAGGPLSLCFEGGSARALTLKPGAIVESTLETADGLPASFRYENAKCQKFLVLACEGGFASPALFRQYTRAKQIAAAAAWFGSPVPAVCAGNPFLYTEQKVGADGTLAVGLWNFFPDDIPTPEIVTDKPYRVASTIGCSVTATAEGNVIRLSRIEPWGFAALELIPE